MNITLRTGATLVALSTALAIIAPEPILNDEGGYLKKKVRQK